MQTLTSSDLETIQSLYDRGLYLQAYEASKALGELKDWRGVDGRVLAGRMAMNLGSARLGTDLHWLAWREFPGSPEVAHFRAYMHMARWGPYFTLQWMDRAGTLAFNDDGKQAEWLALRARCYSLLRDREQADAYIGQANAIAPESRWVQVEHSGVLEHTDRYEEALEVMRKCLDQHPDYRPGLQSLAHLLNLAGKDDEAIELLAGASERLESGALHCQLASLLRGQQRTEEAREQYERGAEKMPLLDPKLGDAWLTTIRSDLASALDEPDKALKLLEQIPDRHKGYFHKQIQKSLQERPADARRKQLDVRFIRQHYRTCAPATLAMIAQYWDKEAEHLEIADAICFDGTPYHAERKWAEDAGYVVAEFTTDLESAKALIDRGIPFTFSTTEPGNGHLQVVAGYDTTRNVLLLRDPFFPTIGEILIDSIDERYGAFGARGMVLVPPDRAGLLDGIELTDQMMWELSHKVRASLIDHERDPAVEALEEMRSINAEHTLTLNAGLTLAGYDNNADLRSRNVEKLIERYPKCPAMVPHRLGCLVERGLRSERLKLLEEASELEDASPLLIHRYAHELAQDARSVSKAQWHLRRLIVRDMRYADAYDSLGSLVWTLGDREEAIRLYRAAACIEDLREHHALSLFRAERFFRREEDAIKLLRERFDRLGEKNPGPARTLYEAYRMMARADLGFEVLEEAIKRLPEDGELALFAAEEMSAYGLQERAAELLAQAKDRSRPLTWLGIAASLATDAGRLAEARGYFEQILEQSPLDIDAHRRWCALTYRLEGREGSLAHLKEMAERFPHHWDLQCELYYDLADGDIEAALPVLRKLLEMMPNDAWAWRELGFRLVEMPGKLEEARAAAERARELDPWSTPTYNLLGRIAEIEGDVEASREAYREAVRLDPDGIYAIEQLFEQYEDRAGRREAAAYILKQLSEQVTFGEGILAYQRFAGRVLDQDELLKDLQQACKERQDLWQSWAALIDQLLLTDHSKTALKVATKAVEKFPLIPTLWRRKAEVHRVRLEADQQIHCLEETLRIAPDYQSAVSDLAEAYEHTGDVTKSERMLREAIDREPRSARYHTFLADLLWRADRHDEALDHIEQAVRLAPTVFDCWDRFLNWAARLNKPELPTQVARALAKERASEPDIWLNLAEVLYQPEHLDERLQAIEKSIELNPRNPAGHDLKAQTLVAAHRFEDARAACNPEIFGGRPPSNLRGRACWIDYETGQPEAAIKNMWAVIKDEPTYEWGLKLLVEWCGDMQDYEGQVRASDLLVKVDPNDHAALGYRSHARLMQADDMKTTLEEREELRALAKQDLDRATKLAPDYGYGVDRLFHLHLEDEETDLATQLAHRCGGYLEEEPRLVMRIELACATGDKEAAEAGFRELCLHKTDQAWAFATAYEAADKLGIARPICEEMIQTQGANPFIAELLIRPLTDRQNWKKAIKFTDGLKGWPEGWGYAAGFLFNAMGETGIADAFRPAALKFYNKHFERIMANERAWEGAIYFMACYDYVQQVLDLFQGWENRPNLKQWMLCNLANAYLTTGQDDMAFQIVNEALQMPPDHSYPLHVTDLARMLALRGDPHTAEQALDSIVPDHLHPGYRFTYHISRALVAAMLRPADGQAIATQELKLAKRARPDYKRSKSAMKAYRQTVKAIGACGGFMDKLRGLWRSLN